MGAMRQCGDPVCPPCLCQHHMQAYAEVEPFEIFGSLLVGYTDVLTGGIIVQAQITTTERCCINVNAATMTGIIVSPTAIEIERPIGSIRTTQEDVILTGAVHLHHHAAWEVLDPGVYIYYLMNRSGANISAFAAWLKIIASDCEG